MQLRNRLHKLDLNLKIPQRDSNLSKKNSGNSINSTSPMQQLLSKHSFRDFAYGNISIDKLNENSPFFKPAQNVAKKKSFTDIWENDSD